MEGDLLYDRSLNEKNTLNEKNILNALHEGKRAYTKDMNSKWNRETSDRYDHFVGKAQLYEGIVMISRVI